MSSFKDYNVLKNDDFSIVKRLYDKLYQIKSDSFEYSYANTFITTYISNICKKIICFKMIKTLKIYYEDIPCEASLVCALCHNSNTKNQVEKFLY